MSVLRYDIQCYVCSVCFCCIFSFGCWLVSPIMVLMYLPACGLLLMSLVLLGIVKTCLVLCILCLSLFLLCSWIVMEDLAAFAVLRFCFDRVMEFSFCILRRACDNFLFLFSVYSLKFVFVYSNRQ